MKSVKELLSSTMIARVSATLAADAERVQKDFAEIVAAQTKKGKKGWITGQVALRGKAQVQTLCRAWNVSESQLVRLAIYNLLKDYGFEHSQLLTRKDFRAMNRSTNSRRPFTTRRAASDYRRKDLVQALDQGSTDGAREDDGVHEAGPGLPEEE